MKQKILALITAQESCKRIIDIAKEYAAHLSADVEVLTVQPVKADAADRSKDMICLTELSKVTGCEIKIVYSDKPLKVIVSECEKQLPIHIFIGQGDDRSSFLSKLRMAPIGSPISVVGADSIIYTLPAMPEEVFYKII